MTNSTAIAFALLSSFAHAQLFGQSPAEQLVGETLASSAHYSTDDFSSAQKIDIHAHIHTDDVDFVSLSQRDAFRFVNMAVWSGTAKDNLEKHRTMWVQYEAMPDRTAPVCSFPIENWDDEDWEQKTIQYLQEQFDRGAVGVKIWKNIGMELKDSSGRLVMVDDPKLQPVISFIESQRKVLLGHLGEPKNCWLPIEEMTTLNDQGYFSANPKYHMYLHPDMPSYEDQIAARDRMLALHPKLVFVGCHLASLEWSVDRIAAFLDRFPNATVGVAARMGQVQYQTQADRAKVIAFFTRYQDRVLYGTDSGVRPGRGAAKHAYVHEKWLRDWKFFNTDQMVEVPELSDPVQGLALPKVVVEKIYRKNALRVFAASWPSMTRAWSLDDLGWLAGNWSSGDEKNETREVWMPAAGTMMVGMNRTVRGDAKTSFEFLRIESANDQLHYLASPSGKPATSFRLVELDLGYQRAVFENKKNSFPQRIIYDRDGQTLNATIEGEMGGRPQMMSWKWRASPAR